MQKINTYIYIFGFPSKIVALESNTRSHPFYHASMHCWNANNLGRYSPQNITQSKIRWIGRFYQYGHVPPNQELEDTQHIQLLYFSNIPKSSVIILQTLSFFGTSWLAIYSESSPVDWGCRIRRLHLYRGVRPLPSSVLDMKLNHLMVRL